VNKRSVDRLARARVYSPSRLGEELSAVINRVRRAFGPIPMWGAASKPQVGRAEQALERVAGQLLCGEVDGTTWHQALLEYECMWMALLDQLRGAESTRHAA
jgi:hypothetical protein